MMTDLRLFVSDIDGTLVRDDKTLSDAVVVACQRLMAAGVPVSLISARPPSGMLWIAEKLGLSVPIGAFNGGTIVSPDGTILSAARISPDVAKRTLEIIDRPGVVRWLFNDGRWYADRPNALRDDRERKAANQEPTFGADFAGLLGAVDKIVAVSEDPALLTELEGLVAAMAGKDATVSKSQPYFLDVTAPAANKGDGVAALAAAMGVPLEHVAVIGDQYNDVPMFRRAGLSIAMGQGPEDVRKAATYVTASNDDDGVAQAIAEILLPMRDRPPL
ncbi:MAG: Cof-like hydrolase family protein [Novosphingobium sp.]|nr:Cof-like hydrolase family protein [Novosphingobium sp.]